MVGIAYAYQQQQQLEKVELIQQWRKSVVNSLQRSKVGIKVELLILKSQKPKAKS